MGATVKAAAVIVEREGMLLFKLTDSDQCRDDLKRGRYIAGEMLTVTIKSADKDITDPQRRFYRGFIVPIFAEWMGEPDLDDVHQILAWRFLRIEDHPTMGTPRRKSTARGKMTAEEMRDFLERVMAWGTVSHGLRFPEPEQA